MNTTEELQQTKSTMSMLTPKDGDLKIEWDRHNAIEVEHAQAAFDKMKGKGYAAFKLNRAGDRGEQLHHFDASAERIVMVPAVVGG